MTPAWIGAITGVIVAMSAVLAVQWFRHRADSAAPDPRDSDHESEKAAS